MPDPSFVFAQSLSGLTAAMFLFLIASGLSLIFGVLRVINLAHGELMMLGAYTTFWLYALTNVNPLLTLPVSALLMFALGAVIERTTIEQEQFTEYRQFYGVFVVAALGLVLAALLLRGTLLRRLP